MSTGDEHSIWKVGLVGKGRFNNNMVRRNWVTVIARVWDEWDSVR